MARWEPRYLPGIPPWEIPNVSLWIMPIGAKATGRMKSRRPWTKAGRKLSLSGTSRSREAVDRLLNGKVLVWSQGRFEWGPRALGNRSILADPRSQGMKDLVNTKIKFREPFRPCGVSRGSQ